MRADRTYVQMLLVIPVLAMLLALLMWSLGVGFADIDRIPASRAPVVTASRVAGVFPFVVDSAVEAAPGIILGSRP